MKIYEHDKLVVRTLENQDASLLAKWLSNPEILQYYEGRDCPFNEQLVIEKYFNRDDKVTGCIVEYETVQIGYIQYYLIDDEERREYGYCDINEIIYGLDQFIGETKYWNKGIGTKLVKSMVEYLLKEKNVDKVIMDPQCWNHRAIACYEKCGFVKKKLLPFHEMHEGEKRDCWLIEYSRCVVFKGMALMPSYEQETSVRHLSPCPRH